jgi:nucleoside-diphosphate-sugar epimerase
MKLIITGANGFIGKHLCMRLKSEGWSFVCLVRPGAVLPFFDENHIQTIQMQGEVSLLAEMFKNENVTGIVHLASHFVAEHQEKDLSPLVLTNILFGTQVLDASVKAGVKWFLNTGTFWQHYNGATYDPVNLYAATKQALEDIGRFYANAHGLRFCTLKLCDTCGPNDTRNKIFNLWEKIAKSGETLDMSPGDQLIDIVHVDQVVQSYLRLIAGLNSECLNGENCESYYVTSNQKISLKELAREYERTNRVKLNINWGARSYRRREVMAPACIGRRIDDLPNFSGVNSVSSELSRRMMNRAK